MFPDFLTRTLSTAHAMKNDVSTAPTPIQFTSVGREKRWLPNSVYQLSWLILGIATPTTLVLATCSSFFWASLDLKTSTHGSLSPSLFPALLLSLETAPLFSQSPLSAASMNPFISSSACWLWSTSFVHYYCVQSPGHAPISHWGDRSLLMVVSPKSSSMPPSLLNEGFCWPWHLTALWPFVTQSTRPHCSIIQ